MDQAFIKGLRESSRQLVREWNLLRDEVQNVGISPSQCHALIEFEQEETLSCTQLSDILVLDKSTTSRTIQALEKKELVNLSISEVDKRQKLYRISRDGFAILDKVHEISNEQVHKAMELMTDPEQKLVAEGLRIYARALRQVRLQSDYTLRPIQAADNKQVAKVIRKVMTEFGAVGEGYSINDPEVDSMYESYNLDHSAFFVIEKAGKILGCGGIAPLEGATEGVCELRKMYFFPELRGLGFGKRLLKKCLEAAIERGYKQCYLETLERMWQANKLYEKMGFKPLTCQMGATGHNACDRFLVLDLA